MPYFTDSSGRLVEADASTPEQLAALRTQGYTPATQQDIDKHNHAEDLKAAEQNSTFLGTATEAGQRVVGRTAGAIGGAMGITGTRPGLADENSSAAEQLFPEATSEQARLRAEARPFATTVGQMATVTPAAIALGAGAGAAAGAAGASALVGTGAAIATESAVEAVAQEYENSWLEQRPMELQNVASMTGMFSLMDVAFRGAGKLAGKAWQRLRGTAKSEVADNIVSTSNAKLRKEAGPLGQRPKSSAGAASAADLDEPYDAAIKTMSDRDAYILARDADDYLPLVATHSADSFNRLRTGLDEQLSSSIKYEYFEKGAAKWGKAENEAQSRWLTEIVDHGQEIADRLRASPKGDIDAIDYGNLGKVVRSTIDDYSRRLSQEMSGAKRNYLVDNYKKRLDRHMMQIDGAYTADQTARKELKDQIRPLVERLRTGLEEPAMWGENALLQRELNPGWHQLLKHWSGLQKKLYERTGETLYDNMGAGRNVMEATTKRINDLLAEDPRFRKELGAHLSGAFDGLQDLIAARQRRGIVRTEGLHELSENIAFLKQDWNNAGTIGVAVNKTKHAKRDPAKWASMVASVAEHIPVAGKAVSAARTLGNVTKGTRLTKGSAIADVWDQSFDRYAKHPDLADPGISRNYSPWLQQALKDHGGKVAGAGLLGTAAAQGQGDEGDVQQASLLGVAGAALLGGRGLRSIYKHASSDILSTEVHMVREMTDELWPKLTREEADTLRGYTQSSMHFKRLVEHEAQGGIDAQGKETLGRLRSAMKKLEIKDPTDGAPLFRGMDLTAGQLENLQKAKEIQLKNLSSTTYFPEKAEEFAAANPWAKTKGFMARSDSPKEMTHPVILAFEKADRGSPKFPSREFLDHPAVDHEAEVILPEGGVFKIVGIEPTTVKGGPRIEPTEIPGFTVRLRQTGSDAVPLMPARDKAATLELEQTTTYRNLRDTLPEGERFDELFGDFWAENDIGDATYYKVKREFHQMVDAGLLRMRKEPDGSLIVLPPGPQEAEPLIGGKRMLLSLGLGLGVSAEVLAGGQAQAATPERPPPPVDPQAAYTQALRENARGGTAMIGKMAARMVRGQPIKLQRGDGLEGFTGRRSLEDAFSDTQEMVRQLAGDPEELVGRLAASTGALARTHPSVYSAMVSRAASIVAYLQQTMPQSIGRSVSNPDGLPPPHDQMIDWAFQFLGAARPVASMRAIVAGTAPQAQIDAVSVNWPELLDQFRAEVAGSITRMAEEGSILDPERLGRIDRSLGFGGRLDAMQAPDMSAFLGAAMASIDQDRQQGAGKKSGGGSQSTRYQTRLGGIRAGREMQ